MNLKNDKNGALCTRLDGATFANGISNQNLQNASNGASVQNWSVRLIYADDAIAVIEKNHGIKSAPLTTEENDTALNFVLKNYPHAKNVIGKKNVECGLLHRLDTDTHGLLLVALNQVAFDALCKMQAQNAFYKEYTAFCTHSKNQDFPPFVDATICAGSEIKSYFRYFGPKRRLVLPVSLQEKALNTKASQKAEKNLYETKILSIENGENFFVVKCALCKGFRHQVRSHLAWACYPIIGDSLYNPHYANGANFASPAKNAQDKNFVPLQLHATKLSFLHPLNGKRCTFELKFAKPHLQDKMSQEQITANDFVWHSQCTV